MSSTINVVDPCSHVDAHEYRRPIIESARAAGGWTAACFILAMEATERLAFYSLAANLVTYLLSDMHEPLAKSVTTVTNWIGAAYILGIPGGFLADSYLGRFYTIILHSIFYILGLALTTVSATVSTLRPPACETSGSDMSCEAPSKRQEAVLLCGLYLVALGTGGIKACVSAFGADQFQYGSRYAENMSVELEPEAVLAPSTKNLVEGGSDQCHGHIVANPGQYSSAGCSDLSSLQQASFFNWFFFTVNIGALFAFTVVVYVQGSKGWGVGVAIALGVMVASLVILVAGSPMYRRMPAMGSPLTRFAQVLVAASRNRLLDLPQSSHELFELDMTSCSTTKLPHTNTFRWLDKAAIITSSSRCSPWRLCTVTQIEELKLFLKLAPIMATTLFLWTGYTQLVTLFVKQGSTMDRRMGGHFEIPAASLPIFSVVNALLVLPLYDKALVPVVERASGGRRKGGFTPLQRMGFGLAVSICAMVAAALVEEKRRAAAAAAAAVPMSIFWLVPQYFLVGLAEVFTYVGQLHFFYGEVSPGMRSLSTSLFISELGIGSWISSLLVTIVQRATGGGGEDDQRGGWILDNINKSRIDRFYWLLAALSSLNFALFLVAASRHRYKSAPR